MHNFPFAFSMMQLIDTLSQQVLILSSSPRKGGNSETLAAAFAKGAQEAGNQVELVHLREKQYGFCKGCFACLKLGHCVIKDDARPREPPL